MPTLALPANNLLTQEEAAAFLRANPRTMENWRLRGYGPVFVKIGRRVAYRLADIEAWIERQTRQHTGQSDSTPA